MKRFAAFWYDFVVGDDWLLAAGVVAALVVTAAAARTDLQLLAWLVMPLGAALTLAVSLLRAAR